LGAPDLDPGSTSALSGSPVATGRLGFGLVVESDELQTRPRPTTTAGRWRRTLAGDNRGFVLRRWLAVSDLTALIVAWIFVVVVAPLGTPRLPDTIVVLALLPAWTAIANAIGLYHLPDRRLGHSLADEIGPIIFALTLWSWAVLLVRGAWDETPVELLPSVGLWAVGIITVAGFRAATRAVSRHRPWYQQRVAVLGTAGDVQKVIRRLERHPEFGLDVTCVVKINGDPAGYEAGSDENGDPVSAIDLAPEVVRAAKRAQVHRVVVASSPGDIDQRSELIRALSELRVHIDLVSADVDAVPSRGSLHYIEGLPMLTVPVVRKPRSRIAFKRVFDLAVASVGLVVLSPLLAYCALRIRLDSPGRALFRQERVGKGGRRFQMLKFRTMVSDAEADKHELVGSTLHRSSEVPGLFKIPGDPRTTEIGETLRRWSIDELPQLWNVLRGDMSLVGPRPLIPEEAELVGGHYKARSNARPGITGPWQTLGRSDIGFEDMVKLDYTYVTNWSFSDDVKLLIRTVGAVLRRRGAY
jgi:exopolysaccharide biosynthesis polyprenyl glycosylphosphotransferase